MMERLPSGLIDEAELVGVAQELARFASPQTDRMEAEPAVQDFIGNCVVPMLASRGLTGKRDAMGNLVIDLTAIDPDFYFANGHKWMYRQVVTSGKSA